MNKKTLFFTAVAMIAGLSLKYIWSLRLAEIDHLICYGNYGSSELTPRVSEMTFKKKFEEVLQIGVLENSLLVTFVLLPFLPTLFAMVVSNSIKYHWVLFVLQATLVLVLWSLLGSPESMHDCDRKGITPVLFYMPFLFFLNLIGVATIALIMLMRKWVAWTSP